VIFFLLSIETVFADFPALSPQQRIDPSISKPDALVQVSQWVYVTAVEVLPDRYNFT